MAVSYKRLWKLLIDKDMSQVELMNAAGIAPNTMTKLRRDKDVTLGVLGKICFSLGCNVEDIIEYKELK